MSCIPTAFLKFLLEEWSILRVSMPGTLPSSTWAQYELGEGTEAELAWEDVTGNE